ncbi:MAG: hypothetical protein DHS20C06_01000 [Hyphobacterium sp.]|nr:MAG: hypothetical protein DHS20C06_01000 [Hyphobacterium sp.]
MRNILVPLAVLLASHGSALARTEDAAALTETRTDWVVQPAEGMDALLLIGAIGGDVLQAPIFSETISFLRENLSPEGLAAIDEIDFQMRQTRGQLTGPTLALIFSAGPVATLDDVMISALDPDGRLRPGLEQSPNWNADRYASIVEAMPIIHTALTALRDVGYERWYASTNRPPVAAGIERIAAAVSQYDIIPEQARLLGRDLDPRIDILVVRFNQPYGIRILGQRFIAFYEWEAATQLRVAAHEIFHPPFDLEDDSLWTLMSDLEADPWMASIVEDHDPAFGYNSFQGVINEGATQALDQIVSDRLGFGRDPARRWQHADGGMHLFAAALYHALIEDDFDDTGGVFEDWFRSALERGVLSPSEVQRRAAAIVGQDSVNLWGPDRAGSE